MARPGADRDAHGYRRCGLRYRTYDIDLVINRTLVYRPLTAMLVVVYVVGVLSFQNAFRTLTERESQIAVVASTLAIAALFNPLRKRLQTFVDRRFYRRKYDAAETLAAAQQSYARADLDALNTELVSVVQETMQPAHASLWLRPDSETQSPPLLRRLNPPPRRVSRAEWSQSPLPLALSSPNI